MSPSNPTTHERERQYRPTYNSLPKSRSSINFGAPFLPPIQPTIPKSESSVNFGAPIPPSTKTTTRRRRHKSDLHSAPTVATSNLTASASQMFMHPANRLLTPTKIPSPTRTSLGGGQSQRMAHSTADGDYSGLDGRSKQTSKAKAPVRKQFVIEKSTQVLPTPQEEDREETPEFYQPKPRYRVPTPAPSAQPAPPLTRARTLQAFTSLTSSFSLSNLRQVSSQLSLRGKASNTARSSSGPAAFFSKSSRSRTPTQSSHDLDVNLRDVRTGMPQSYWAGRYRTLDDMFHSEDFDIDYLGSPAVLEALIQIEREGESFEDDNMSSADQLRYRRVFAVLETHCKTTDAKKSLWSFQQAYARNLKCQQLLPAGGTIQEKENIFFRAAGKLFNRNRAASGLGDKRSMKNEKKAEARMSQKKVVERSLLEQKKQSNKFDKVMEALRYEESY
ncbi:hypothetical protein VE03_06724 [Pseudogymnoascus sp. 23342-1-I1]|nr:hypothetical protein VE03_06724 [Pseudogymnoascus sp. 23342-1-I1]